MESGIEAKLAVQHGEVYVNGEIDTRRGKKLYNGDKFSFNGEEVIIKAPPRTDVDL